MRLSRGFPFLEHTLRGFSHTPDVPTSTPLAGCLKTLAGPSTVVHCRAHTDLMNTTLFTMWLPTLVLLPCLGIWIYSLVDFSRTNEQDMRTLSADVWLVVLVLGSVAGAIGWLVAGRPQVPGAPHRP